MSESRADLTPHYNGHADIGFGTSADSVIENARRGILLEYRGIKNPPAAMEAAQADIAAREDFPIIHRTHQFSGRVALMRLWEGEEYQQEIAKLHIENLIENHGCVGAIILEDMKGRVPIPPTVQPNATVELSYHHAHAREIKLRQQRQAMPGVFKS